MPHLFAVTLSYHVPDHCNLECLVSSVLSFHIRFVGDVGRDSSVGIATRYGLDGPIRIESWWGRGFPHPSRPALGPTQPPVQWVPGLSRG